MMTENDIRASKDEIQARYPKGSPEFPSHAAKCGCSGCFASWLEWRSAHAAYELGQKTERTKIIAWLRNPSRDVRDYPMQSRVGRIVQWEWLADVIEREEFDERRTP